MSELQTPQDAENNTAAANPKEGFNLSRWALQNAPLTRYLMIVLMLFGIAAYFQLGQDEDPPFEFRAMMLRAYWPGATTQQMAELVGDPMEKTLQEVPHVKRVGTYSKPGELTILFEAAENIRGSDIQNVWYTVRKHVGDKRYLLPQGVQGPFFNDEFGDVFGIIYALQADNAEYSSAELKYLADGLRQRLLRVKDVNKVEIWGVQPEMVYINISNQRLAKYGLDMQGIIAQLGQQNAVEATGQVETPSDVVQIRMSGQFQGIEQLKAMPIKGANGRLLKLADIADVERGYQDPPPPQVHFNGKPMLALGLSMSKGGDVIRLGKNLHTEIAAIEQTLPAGVSLKQVQDQPKVVADSVTEFVQALMEAVVIVLLVSFVSLGLHKGGRLGWFVDMRPGWVVGICIPLVLAITFISMKFFDIGLHKISLGALIIALGLLVDDAIIAIEMMVRKLEEGHNMMDSASYAYDHTAKPMLTGTLITAAGFLPIGMARSITGEYTFAIFAVTVLALIISWVVSVYFLPYIGSAVLKVKPHVGEHKDIYDTPFYRRFRSLVQTCIEHRWKTILITMAVFALGVVGMGKVEQQFFPDSARMEVMVDYWLPEGASMQANQDLGQRLEKRLLATNGVESVASWMGSGIPHFYLPHEQLMPQTNVGQLMVQPKTKADRDRLREQLPQQLNAEFPEALTRVRFLPSGPPVKYPVEFRIVGPDPIKLRTYADHLKDLMRANPNTRNVNDNWNEKVKVLRLDIDQDKARALGVTSQSLAQASNIFYSGATIGQLRERNDLISIVLRQSPNDERRMSDLQNIYVATSTGRSIPLAQIARPVLDWEPGVMWRLNGDYAITVNADIRDGIQPATVTEQLQPVFAKAQKTWPADYRMLVAGAAEMSATGSESIAAGFPLMLFLTFTLLMLQLKSFSRSLLVFLTGFLGVPGVAAALLLLQRPFGFVALLGFIALFGMIQRNSVILIDQIEEERKRGHIMWDAILIATVQRMRPIALTAAAAILAMIPLTRSLFWGPMAVAIMGGLVAATALTLLSLPAMYAAWMDTERRFIDRFFPSWSDKTTTERVVKPLNTPSSST
jgi:multidrug efflux pump subunit AcrB